MAYKGTVYCLRGLPGSGKSVVAAALAASTTSSQICSADMFLVKDGKYIWTRDLCNKAHMACQELYQYSLRRNTRTIVVDNVNSRRSDIHSYRALAIEYGYRFVPIVVGTLDVQYAFTNNTHDVPYETIEKMAKNWDWDIG